MGSSSRAKIEAESRKSPAQVMLPSLEDRYVAVRAFTKRLCDPLEAADFEAQAMADCSPVKWHLGHTAWFFEEFVLRQFEPSFAPFHPRFGFLFNSYYDAVGARQLRAERGLLSRPALDLVYEYRHRVDERITRLLHQEDPTIYALVELGCHHEQQHQELILTDLKCLFSKNPLLPAYHREAASTEVDSLPPLAFQEVEAGLVTIGAGDTGFAFDNERPRHRVFLEPFAVADRLITNLEYQEFIADGGYRRPELWLDQGFAEVIGMGWHKPLYWRGGPEDFREFSLFGERDLPPHEPVSHVSLYEADAFARWAGARLLREAEWEWAFRDEPVSGNLADRARFHPAMSDASEGTGAGRGNAKVTQCYGDVWEWTASPYVGYPGFAPARGAIGEYNGKFMCNQFVLRGGSCATPRDHVRSTYRNFFYAKDRWQFTGIRLGRDRR